MAAPGIAIRGQRSLLRQIREALAGGGPAQSRLDMVVRIIARSMVAEVCSLYMRGGANDMELFATEGLDPTAVHVTRLKPGEGLVGEILRLGRPLNLSDAMFSEIWPSAEISTRKMYSDVSRDTVL